MGCGDVGCGLLDNRQQVGVAHQIGHPELHQAGLTAPSTSPGPRSLVSFSAMTSCPNFLA